VPGFDVSGVDVAVNEHVLRVEHFNDDAAVHDVELHKAPAVEFPLLLVDHVADFELVLLDRPRPILVQEEFPLRVAFQILEVEVGLVVQARQPRGNGLLREGDGNALTLGQAVRDNRIAVEFVILRPLLMAALTELEVALYVCKEGVEGNH
jgi:hypothetical protein